MQSATSEPAVVDAIKAAEVIVPISRMIPSPRERERFRPYWNVCKVAMSAVATYVDPYYPEGKPVCPTTELSVIASEDTRVLKVERNDYD